MMLEFRDCPYCGKRIRVDAENCHKCGKTVSEATRPRTSANSGSTIRGKPVNPDREGSPDQAAVYGGYDAKEDDFDYEEFLQEEFGKPKKKRNFWYYVAWVVIASLMLPIVLQVLKLLGA
jgi:hypothetical protein